MQLSKNHLGFIIASGLALLLLPLRAFAFCPLCVVATGGLTSFFRWLGVDDTIIGLWLGGFITSSSILLGSYLARKKWKIKPHKVTIVFAFYLLTMILLYLDGILTTPYNMIFGISKIIIGITIGSIIILITPYLNVLLRKINNDRSFISHQKMLVSISLLSIFSLFFYFLIK